VAANGGGWKRCHTSHLTPHTVAGQLVDIPACAYLAKEKLRAQLFFRKDLQGEFCFTRHTSHVTRHTSHVTRHTPHVTRHTSHATRHTYASGVPATPAFLASITLGHYARLAVPQLPPSHPGTPPPLPLPTPLCSSLPTYCPKCFVTLRISAASPQNQKRNASKCGAGGEHGRKRQHTAAAAASRRQSFIIDQYRVNYKRQQLLQHVRDQGSVNSCRSTCVTRAGQQLPQHVRDQGRSTAAAARA
jgi:hypothetical protein